MLCPDDALTVDDEESVERAAVVAPVVAEARLGGVDQDREGVVGREAQGDSLRPGSSIAEELTATIRAAGPVESRTLRIRSASWETQCGQPPPR